MLCGKAETPQNCFCRGFSITFERAAIASKGNQTAITADLPPEDGHWNITRIQYAGIGERWTVLHFYVKASLCILPAKETSAERACTSTKTHHAGMCQQWDLREKQEKTTSSSAITLLMYLQGFSSMAFSFLSLLSPNANNKDSVSYFITSIFSEIILRKGFTVKELF